MAAADLQSGNERIIDIAAKYGYRSPTAFNRAFQAFHGIAPSSVKNKDVSLKSFSPIVFHIAIKGAAEIDYRIETKSVFRIVGVSAPIDKKIEKSFAEVPKMWQASFANGTVQTLAEMMDSPAEQLQIRYCEKYAVATNHFISSEMERYNNEEINWYRTTDRFQTLETFLNCNEVDFAISRELIAGKYGFTCQYEKKLHFDTIWSVVYDLSDLYNEICEGNPSKLKFKYDNRLAWGLKKKYGTDTSRKE